MNLTVTHRSPVSPDGFLDWRGNHISDPAPGPHELTNSTVNLHADDELVGSAVYSIFPSARILAGSTFTPPMQGPYLHRGRGRIALLHSMFIAESHRGQGGFTLMIDELRALRLPVFCQFTNRRLAARFDRDLRP